MRKVFNEEFGEKYYLNVRMYPNNRLAILVSKEDDEYEVYEEDITTNVPNIEIDCDNQIFLSNYLSDGAKYLLLDKGIISKTLDIRKYNNIEYQVVNVNFDKLKEYDNYGVEVFLKCHKDFKSGSLQYDSSSKVDKQEKIEELER